MANILGFGSQNTKLHTSFSTTLPASDWTNGTLEIHDPSLFATGQYDYLIGPAPASRDEYTACAVWAERLAGDGKLLFRCETDPESDLSVQVLRFETPDADIARVFNAEGGGGGGNMQNRLEALETTVGNDAAGLVKDVAENTADLTALQSDVSEVQQQQTAQDAAISGNTAAISNVSERVSAAQTAANNAQEIADKAQSGLDGKLSLSGGTMAGVLNVLTPTVDQEAANKAYVDSLLSVTYVTNNNTSLDPNSVHSVFEGVPISSNVTFTSYFNLPKCVTSGTYRNKTFKNIYISSCSNSVFNYCLFINCYIADDLKTSNCNFYNCIISNELFVASTSSFEPKIMFFNTFIRSYSMKSEIIGTGYKTEAVFINCKASNISSIPEKIRISSDSYNNATSWMNS